MRRLRRRQERPGRHPQVPVFAQVSVYMRHPGAGLVTKLVTIGAPRVAFAAAFPADPAAFPAPGD